MHLAAKIVVGLLSASVVSVGGVFVWQKQKSQTTGDSSDESSDPRQDTSNPSATASTEPTKT